MQVVYIVVKILNKLIETFKKNKKHAQGSETNLCITNNIETIIITIMQYYQHIHMMHTKIHLPKIIRLNISKNWTKVLNA